MDQNIQPIKHHLLIVVNTHLKSSRTLLETFFSVTKQIGSILIYAFHRYEEGEVILIEPNSITLQLIELVVVIGQNKDLTNTFSYFFNRTSPSILGFGSTEDFTSPLIYNFCRAECAEEILRLVMGQKNWTNFPGDNLMKLSLGIDCKKIGQATCQIEIHRGMNQAILTINIYVENPCDKEKIKIAQFKGDGLLLSTPMGSFCKSLSFNAPLMERTMENILITPICPLSMKFRPICLPANTRIFLELDQYCRSNRAEIYIDDRAESFFIEKGQWLRIKMSKFKTKMLSNLLETKQQFFIRSLKNVLRWGTTYESPDLETIRVKRLSSLQ